MVRILLPSNAILSVCSEQKGLLYFSSSNCGNDIEGVWKINRIPFNGRLNGNSCSVINSVLCFAKYFNTDPKYSTHNKRKL